jgi:hypothetical protein
MPDPTFASQQHANADAKSGAMQNRVFDDAKK